MPDSFAQLLPTMWIDSQMYPHILDTIAMHAPYAVLVALRATSRLLKMQVDAVLFRHLTLTNVEGSFAEMSISTPHGRHPALLDWPSAGARGVYKACSNCIIANMNSANDVSCELSAPWRHTKLSKSFKATRIVDIIGATLMEGVTSLSSVFGSVDVMRFMPAWGVDVDMEGEEGMVWPKDMTRQTLGCDVKTVVWLGDIRHSSGQRCEAVPEVPGARYVYSWLVDAAELEYIDFRHEVPAGATSAVVLYRHAPASLGADADGGPKPTPFAFVDALLIEPYSEVARTGIHCPMTVAGFFDLDLDFPAFDESNEEYFMRMMGSALPNSVMSGTSLNEEEGAAVLKARLGRIKTVSLGEYVAELGAEERALILGE